MTELLRLERFAAELVALRDIPPDARRIARDCLADALACAAAGQARAVHDASTAALAGLFGSTADATVWFRPERANPLLAAYLNSVAVSADDLDDGNRAATGHPGAAVVPAVLVEAELAGDGDVLGAIAVGYEAGVRFAAARRADLPTLASGRWAGVAAAAASCWLAGDDAGTTAAALAHAASLSPQLVAPDPRRTDAIKEGTPWGVVVGLVATRLARAGVAAPTYLLERHPDFDRHDDVRVGGDLAVGQTYFKRYACCRWIHPVIDALTAMHSARPIDAAAVDRVEVTTFARGLTLSNKARPATLEDAHYSFPFCAALALLHGPSAFLPLTERFLRDRAVLRLAKVVTLSAGPALDRSFPRRTPAVVRVHVGGEIREMAVDTAQGDPILPFAPGVLRAKHRHLLRLAPGGALLEDALRDDPVRPGPLLAALGARTHAQSGRTR
jgi:2-methylcitrate dehydratase PrpD